MDDVLKQMEIEEDDTVTVEGFTPYDPADDLISDEGIAYFMEGAFETGDPEFIAHALSTAARAKGMMKISQETGLSREELSVSFDGKSNQTLGSALAVMKALGISIGTKVTEKSHEMA